MTDREYPPAAKRLTTGQLVTYDQQYASEEMQACIVRLIEETFPTGRFTFLDVGGGNGLFCDALLDGFPHAAGTLVDSAEVLLARNSQHPRKTLVHASAENLSTVFCGRSFDILFLQWLLHHCVGNSYAETRLLQRQVLLGCRGLLPPHGRVSILENLYDGLFACGLPGRLIFALTSSTVLAPLTRRLGANTAGCGVCFLSGEEWRRTFRLCGFELADTRAYKRWSTTLSRRVFLHIGSVRVGHFWLKPRGSRACHGYKPAAFRLGARPR